MRKLEPIKIIYDKTLREVLFGDFKSTGKKFPIKGGWGYAKEDAIIIDKNDPVATQWFPLDAVAIEYIIAKQRIYEELIIFREKGDKFSQLNINLLKQSLIAEKEKKYDKLVFEVTAFHDKDFENIYKEMVEISKKPRFDFDIYLESKKELRYHYTSEFWFDITADFGKF